MEDVTLRQTMVLAAIKQFQNEHGYSPTVRELSVLLGLKSTSTVQHHLDELEEKGFIERNPSCPRTIRVRIGDVVLK